jgi:hypothetical protein
MILLRNHTRPELDKKVDITQHYHDDGVDMDKFKVQSTRAIPVKMESNGHRNEATTYSISYKTASDGSIRNALLALIGFMQTDEAMIDTSGNEVGIEEFLSSLKIISKNQILDLDGHEIIGEGHEVPFRLVTQRYGTGHLTYKDICDKGGKIYIEMDLTHPTHSRGSTTFDGYIGAALNTAINRTAFTASWLVDKSAEVIIRSSSNRRLLLVKKGLGK